MAHPHKTEAEKTKSHKLWSVASKDRAGKEWGSKIKAAIHAHERHDHPGTKLTPLKSGGTVKGKAPKHRADKNMRSPKHINIIVAPKQKTPVPVPVPAQSMPQRAPAIAQPMPPGMAMKPPMGGGMPPMKKGGRAKYAAGGKVKAKAGGGATTPDNGKKKGGKVKRMAGGRVPLTGGAGGGEGRLEKSKAQKMKGKD